MTMGLEASKKLAEELPELDYYFIYENEDGTFGITYSNGFDQYFVNK